MTNKNHVSMLYRDYCNYIGLVEFRLEDKRISHYPLMGGSPLQITIVTIIYLVLTKKVGPKFMESRKPFDLNRQMKFYNIMQIILNSWLAIQQLTYLFNKDSYSFSCAIPDFSETPNGFKEVNFVYAYYALKVLDLCDTLFIVLRKRYNQASFLHLYHHASMCVITQIVTQFIPGGPYSTVVAVNCFIHVIMYSYYFLTSVRPEIKESIWWKKYITQVQMVQFCYLMIHFAFHFFDSKCKYSLFWAGVGFIQNFIFFMLFSNFYLRTYVLKKKQKNV